MHIFKCSYCSFYTNIYPHKNGELEAKKRLMEHKNAHHKCRYCTFFPFNGNAGRHWTVLLLKHEQTCSKKIRQCDYCNYLPKNVKKFNEIHKHIWNQHVHQCRFCGFKPENVEQWKNNFAAHEKFCESKLQTVFQFLSFDVNLNDDMLRQIAFYTRKTNVPNQIRAGIC